MRASGTYVTGRTMEFLNNNNITTTDQLIMVGLYAFKRNYKVPNDILIDIKRAINYHHQTEYNRNVKRSNKMGNIYLPKSFKEVL